MRIMLPVAGLLVVLFATLSRAEILTAPPPFLSDVRWGSAALCGPTATLTTQEAIDAYAANHSDPLIYMDEYGLGFASKPIFCSFHTILGGPMAEEGVYVAHLICATDIGPGDLLTLALLLQPESVGDSTAKLVLRDEPGRYAQDLYLCP